jgi:hypothetical protein
MKSGFAALCAAAFCAGIAFSAAPASAQNRLKTCNDEWAAMKASNSVGDKKYADFRKECLARTAEAPAQTPAAPTAAPAAKPPKPPKAPKAAAAPAPAPATAPAPGAAPADASPGAAATKPTDGRQAMYARERACGAEWKADKAAGKIEQGQTWPKYWSACNTRKKAEGK